MPTYEVSSQVLQLSGTYSQGYQLRNVGLSNVYLGRDTSVSAERHDWTLVPNDTQIFSGDEDVYIVTESGRTSVVDQLYGGNGGFIPGAIINRGVTSPVVFLETSPYNVVAAAQSIARNVLDGADVSEYAAVELSISNLAIAFTCNVLNYFIVTFTQYDDAALTRVRDIKVAHFLIVGNSLDAVQKFIVPVVSRYLKVRISLDKAVTVGVTTPLNVTFVGHYEPLDSPFYLSTCHTLSADGEALPYTNAFVTSLNAGATQALLIPSKSGKAIMNIAEGTSPRFTTYVCRYGSAEISSRLSGSDTRGEIMLPFYPLRIFIEAGASAARFSITM